MSETGATARRGGAWTRLRVVTVVVGAVVAVGLASLADRPVAALAEAHPFRGSPDLYLLCRLAGYVPVWIVVAAALASIDMRRGWRAAWTRGGALIASVLLSGVAAELLKLVVRRERPAAPFTAYAFRPWTENPWSSAGLGWPSSHVAVAFAAVWVLWRLHPRAWPVWLLIGSACAWSRLAFNDHYLSDVVGAAALAYFVATGVAAIPAGNPS